MSLLILTICLLLPLIKASIILNAQAGYFSSMGDKLEAPGEREPQVKIGLRQIGLGTCLSVRRFLD